jgi:phytoene dehydrogenase-like protein
VHAADASTRASASPTSTAAPDALVVGAGLAGLACARELSEAGLRVRILEATDQVGGRVRTFEHEDGFLLDRGFQVLLTAYPETQRLLDYDALQLGRFYSGALVRHDGAFHRVADPFRHPADAPATLMAPIGSLADKLRVGAASWRLRRPRLRELFARPEMTTEAALRERWGFSDTIIDRFFRPFLGGIFLESELRTSSRMFAFVFRMFAEGGAALPAGGMQAMPRQLARALPEDTVHFGTEVTAVEGQTVRLESGDGLEAPAVVVATEAPEAARLLGAEAAGDVQTESRSTTTVYFAAGRPPTDEAALMLNGTGAGPVNTAVVLSNVQPAYAPPGRALISASVLGDPPVSDDELEGEVRRQLRDWFGAGVEGWRALRTVRVAYALPEQAPPYLSPPMKRVRRRPGLYACGDHRRTASINGALASGRAAAQAVLADRRAGRLA